MCVIVFKPKGASLTQAQLHKMWDRNGHGMGFLGKKNQDSEWGHQKGVMDREEAIGILSDYIGPESILVFHFRIKSTGSVCAELTHPFEWSNKKETRYLFHNGTVGILNACGNSDSHTLSEILQSVETKQAYNILTHLSSKEWGRFATVVFSENGEEEIKVFDAKESVWKDGVWFSNVVHETFGQVDHKKKGVQEQTPLLSLPAPKRVVTEDDKNIERIVDFYLEKLKLANVPRNRMFISDTYSLNIMCPTFVAEVVASINEGKDSDPINSFFKL